MWSLAPQTLTTLNPYTNENFTWSVFTIFNLKFLSYLIFMFVRQPWVLLSMHKLAISLWNFASKDLLNHLDSMILLSTRCQSMSAYNLVYRAFWHGTRFRIEITTFSMRGNNEVITKFIWFGGSESGEVGRVVSVPVTSVDGNEITYNSFSLLSLQFSQQIDVKAWDSYGNFIDGMKK